MHCFSFSHSIIYAPNWDGPQKEKQERRQGVKGEFMKKDSLKSAPAEGPRWPSSRLSGDDISKAIKGDDSRQAGSDWQA